MFTKKDPYDAKLDIYEQWFEDQLDFSKTQAIKNKDEILAKIRMWLIQKRLETKLKLHTSTLKRDTTILQYA